MAAEVAQEELAVSITQMLNPRTGQNYTPLEVQRILRADFKRRRKDAERFRLWYERNK